MDGRAILFQVLEMGGFDEANRLFSCLLRGKFWCGVSSPLASRYEDLDWLLSAVGATDCKADYMEEAI